MKIREDQARVQELLKETITLLCKNGLNYKARFSVEALIGVTIDDSEVFLVNIKENVRNENAEPESSSDAETEAETEGKPSNETKKGTPGRKRPPDDGGSRLSESSPVKRTRSNQDIDNDENDRDYEDDNDDGASNMSSTQTDMDSRIGVVKQEPNDEHDLVFVKQEQPDFLSATTSTPGSMHQSFTSQPQPMSVFSHSGQQPQDVNLDMSQDSSWAMNQSASNLDPSNLANMSMASQSASQGGSNQFSPSDSALNSSYQSLAKTLGPQTLHNGVCPYCRKIFKSQSKFRFHMRALHKIGKPIQCNLCGKANFTSETPYYRHMQECKASLGGLSQLPPGSIKLFNPPSSLENVALPPVLGLPHAPQTNSVDCVIDSTPSIDDAASTTTAVDEIASTSTATTVADTDVSPRVVDINVVDLNIPVFPQLVPYEAKTDESGDNN